MPGMEVFQILWPGWIKLRYSSCSAQREIHICISGWKEFRFCGQARWNSRLVAASRSGESIALLQLENIQIQWLGWGAEEISISHWAGANSDLEGTPLLLSLMVRTTACPTASCRMSAFLYFMHLIVLSYLFLTLWYTYSVYMYIHTHTRVCISLSLSIYILNTCNCPCVLMHGSDDF